MKKAELIICLILIFCSVIGVWCFGRSLMDATERIADHQNAYYTDILDEPVPAGAPEIPQDD